MKCKKSNLRLIESNILFIELESNVLFDLSDYYELRRAAIKTITGKPVYTLIHIGDKTIPKPDAREAFCRDNDVGVVMAEAIVIHSLGQRIIARHVLKEKRKYHPFRIFTSVEKAKAWLTSLNKEYNSEQIV